MLKKSLLLIILALLVGLFYVMPQLVFQWSLKGDFQGVSRLINDDELYYMARAQEAVDGHYFISNPYFAEYKNGLPMQTFLPDLIVAMPAKISGISISQLYVFYDFLFPFILFILTYFIFHLLTKNRFWSTILSFSLILGKYFFVFNRPMNPQFVFIFVLSLILLLLVILSGRDKKNNWLVLLAGINFGLLFNFYTYFWTYFITVISLLAVYLLFKKNFYLLKKIIGVLVIGLAVGIPYFYQVWQSGKLEFFQETIQRIGLISTRLPSGMETNILALAALVFFAIHWRSVCKRGEKAEVTGVFLFLGVIAALINMNQHVITGKNMFFSSHYDMISFFFIAFAFIYLLQQIKKPSFLANSKTFKIAALAAMVVFFAFQFSDVLKFDYASELNSQRYAKIFRWLNGNTPKDAVVMANPDLSSYIPAYTHNNVFFSFGGVLFFVSDKEVLDRFVLNNFWQNSFNEEFVKENFHSVYGYQYDAQGGRVKQKNKLKTVFRLEGEDLDQVYYPSEKVKAVLDYRRNIKEEDWISALKKYRIDYLAIDGTNANDLNLESKKFDFLKLTYEINGIRLYKVSFTD
ncbi:MAG: hypothetical protein AAB791_01280 [Patescibacteria group bacterium]